jgi:hypothetical protein
MSTSSILRTLSRRISMSDWKKHHIFILVKEDGTPTGQYSFIKHQLSQKISERKELGIDTLGEHIIKTDLESYDSLLIQHGMNPAAQGIAKYYGFK